MVRLSMPMDRLGDFCKKWQIASLALFGSVLRADFQPQSDVDVLVTFKPEAPRSLLDLIAMEKELAAMLGRPVDLVDRQVLENSPNYIRRDHILKTAESVYGS